MNFGEKVIIILGIVILVFASIFALTYYTMIELTMPSVNGSTSTKQFAGTYIPGERLVLFH